MTAEQHAQQLATELDRFIQIVVEQMQPERIILFGSFASGAIHEWSDLDLVVIAQTDLPFYERLKQVILLVRSTVGMNVVVYTPDEWEHLKAALVAEGTLYPRSHNLPQLLSLLDASTFEGLPELSDGIRLLDRFYISARYPDVVPGALPSGLPTQQDAVEALDVARRAAAIIESTLTAENAEQAMDSP